MARLTPWWWVVLVWVVGGVRYTVCVGGCCWQLRAGGVMGVRYTLAVWVVWGGRCALHSKGVSWHGGGEVEPSGEKQEASVKW